LLLAHAAGPFTNVRQYIGNPRKRGRVPSRLKNSWNDDVIYLGVGVFQERRVDFEYDCLQIVEEDGQRVIITFASGSFFGTPGEPWAVSQSSYNFSSDMTLPKYMNAVFRNVTTILVLTCSNLRDGGTIMCL